MNTFRTHAMSVTTDIREVDVYSWGNFGRFNFRDTCIYIANAQSSLSLSLSVV
jgi:hypothetical protein